MNFFFPASSSVTNQIRSRLLTAAAVFLFLYSLVLTLSPAVRLHAWNVPYRWNHWLGYAIWLTGFALIHRQLTRRLPDHDPYLIPVAALLSGWGLLAIWRLDATFGLRQSLWLAVCLLALWIGLRIPNPVGLLRRYKYVWLTGGLLLTALTFFFGTYPGGQGPRLWLGCCGVYLQPSEPLKLLLIVYLAAYMADSLLVGYGLIQLLPPTLILVGASMGILLAQRDLGTATLFLLLYFLIIYLASGRPRIILVTGGTVLAASLVGYLMFDVIRLRVNAWFNPWAEAAGRSYQIVQSLIAVANGGIFGTGPGMGSPGVVPVAHSDFIFASIAEETGLLGSIGILVLFALIAGRGMLIALRATNNYQRYLAGGLSAYLTVQAILIISGNIRLLPLTGVTLPFVSYGGSSLLTSFVTLLILLLISSQPEEEPAPLTRSTPYLLTGTVLFAFLGLIALVTGWWSTIRAPALLSRPDNPRWAIMDRYVPRGELLDRDNQVLVRSVGQPGTYTRETSHPPLGPVVGYSHPLYGQAGLEASLDGYLRGVRGTPASMIWSNQLLYSQRPPGLQVRTSLDLDLQGLADNLLGGRAGAAVLINSHTGEVLVMASHPYFDPNQIDQQWDQWIQDDDAPLLNRVTQGQYPPGTAIGPFLLALESARGELPPPPLTLTYNYQGTVWDCSLEPSDPQEWGSLVSSGCPGTLVALGSDLGSQELADLYRSLGFGDVPVITLPVAEPGSIEVAADSDLAAIGQTSLRVTPLQMALAAAILSSADGSRPSPLLAAAVNTPVEGWVALPGGSPTPSLPAGGVEPAARLLAVDNSPLWQAVGTAVTADGPVTWFIGGTRPEWNGTPLALVVIIEEDDPAMANEIGQTLLETTISP